MQLRSAAASLLALAGAISAQTPLAFDRDFSGPVDCEFIGNSHSVVPHPANYCPSLSSTEATLSLPAGAEVLNATLYWSTSGNNDQLVRLNNQWINTEQTWSQTLSGGLTFYAQKADVTSLVQAEGAGDYEMRYLTFDDHPYCQRGAAYGGWALLVIYEAPGLPNSFIDVWEGFIGVFNASGNGDGVVETHITNLTFPTECAVKAEFCHLSWDGDAYKNEKFKINGENQGNNTFNGSTASDIDIDCYDISHLVNPGDTSLDIRFENFLTWTSYGNAIEYAPHQVFVVKSEDCEECVLELNHPTPPQLPVVTEDCFTLTGDCFDEITEVCFDNTVLAIEGPGTFSFGSYEVVDPQTLKVCPPLCLEPGVYTITVKAGGQVATQEVTLVEPINATLVCPQTHPAGSDLCLAVSSGSTLPKPNVLFIILSPSSQPSVVPGIINAGLGNMFSNYICGPGYVTECVVECYPIPPALAGDTWYFQAIAWNPAVIQNPLFPTTNLCSTTFQ